jgi:hypothetical protein
LGCAFVSAGRALGHEGVLPELVTQFMDVEFARHAADFLSCRKSRPSSGPLSRLLYKPYDRLARLRRGATLRSKGRITL